MEKENPSIGTTPTVGAAPSAGNAPSPTMGSAPTTQSAPTVGESASAPPIQTSPNVGVENEVISKSNHTSVEENIEVNSRNNRKHKSPVWDHFEEKYVGGKRKAMCPDCKTGTKHLLDHMKSCLYKKQKTINQSILNPTKSNDGSMKPGTYTFDQNQAREELANMIVLHDYPLSMVQHVGFKRYSHALQPLFRVVSRDTIKSDIIRIFEYQRDKTMKLMESNGSRITLTTDIWMSSNQRRGFMAITSHFIDASWKLQSRLVRFIYVPCPHTAEVLANAFVDCLLD
ncbi:zinc finger BED domain-containing protein RICESLEEPER 3-like [Tripterygium wilfordii]|uniref:zinc finger BED domain-containing protein RICESLEEPER 3-like n=1 Tax=Tripterygium wilfordii TaxID=458696 RepID=UPI0018F830E2|nr:zinc finger BED domain-containing protein RICESLEEPER 3-like [Tripterygium wilfordii]